MKLWSYHHVNRNVRLIIDRIRNIQLVEDEFNFRDFIGENEIDDMTLKTLQKSCENQSELLTFSHFVYFILAPTLCYQLNYPKSPKIRWSFVLELLGELIIVSLLMRFSYYLTNNLKSDMRIVHPSYNRRLSD